MSDSTYQELFGSVSQVKYKSKEGYKLTKGSENAAGFDVHASETTVIMAGHRAIIPTGISLEIPSYLYAQVESRSGLAAKQGLTCLCGVIDSDYRGELKIVLINTSRDIVHINKGDRIAQLVFHFVPTVSTVLVEDGSLSNTDRQEGGFGSSGK